MEEGDETQTLTTSPASLTHVAAGCTPSFLPPLSSASPPSSSSSLPDLMSPPLLLSPAFLNFLKKYLVFFVGVEGGGPFLFCVVYVSPLIKTEALWWIRSISWCPVGKRVKISQPAPYFSFSPSSLRSLSLSLAMPDPSVCLAHSCSAFVSRDDLLMSAKDGVPVSPSAIDPW